MSAKPRVPMQVCMEGKHLYLPIFTQCPFHKGRLYNVRLKARFPIFRDAANRPCKEWTFQQMAADPKKAARAVLGALFGWDAGPETTGKYIADYEAWPAARIGISGRDISRGTAE